jgi:hypothetical protein
MQQRCLTEFQLESLQADWLITKRAQIIGGLVFGLIFGLSYDHTTAALPQPQPFRRMVQGTDGKGKGEVLKSHLLTQRQAERFPRESCSSKSFVRS